MRRRVKGSYRDRAETLGVDHMVLWRSEHGAGTSDLPLAEQAELGSCMNCRATGKILTLYFEGRKAVGLLCRKCKKALL